jgi:hypothetical protein
MSLYSECWCECWCSCAGSTCKVYASAVYAPEGRSGGAVFRGGVDSDRVPPLQFVSMPETGVPPRFIKFHPQDHDATKVSDASSSKLIPRRYQEEIFLKAKQRNVIAVLDTGSGKTLICAMLIKWISAQEKSQRKVVIFLVPKVPLVEQQSKFIAKHTSLRVAPVHSDVSAGVMDRDRWSNLFAESDVLVMTGKHAP